MSAAARSFIDRQLGRESAYRMLPTFARGLGQDWLPAWVALLGEIDETAFERSDVRVAQAKLAWWAEDLAAGGAAQHPLSRMLLESPAARQVESTQWRRLAAEALQLSELDASPRDWDEAASRWQGLASSVSVIESRLFASSVPEDAVRVQWQRQRLWHAQLRLQPEQGAAPLAWLAAGSDPHAAVRGWSELSAASERELALEASTQLPLHRALLRSLWQWRLPRLLRGQPPSALLAPGAARLLWRSWRAAVKVSRR